MNPSQLFEEFAFVRENDDMHIINDIMTGDLEANDGKLMKEILLRVKNHKVVMRLVLTALIEDIKFGDLMLRMENWTKKPEWLSLEEKQYAWPLYMIAPELVSWDKLFAMEKTQVFYDFARCDKIPGMVDNVQRRIEMIRFMDTYDYGKVFGSNTPEITTVLTNMRSMRASVGRHLDCINAWTPGWEKYFVTSEPRLHNPENKGARLWKCDKIASQRKSFKRPTVGECSMVDQEEFKKRFFGDITHGMLLKSPNPELEGTGQEFPFDNVVFSGDSIRQALERNYDKQLSSDIDIFVIGPDPKVRKETFEKIIEWFTCKDKIFYGIKGGVDCIYIKDIPIQFQIINTSYSNGATVVSKFDLSHVQWFAHVNRHGRPIGMITPRDVIGYEADYYTITGLQVFGTYRAFESQVTRVTHIVNPAKVLVRRLMKALIRGFDIETDDNIVSSVLDITHLVERPNDPTVRNHIINNAAGFYPRTADSERFGGDTQAENEYILRMIGKETDSTIVTVDPLVVISKTELNINIDVEYDSLSYTRFSSDSVINEGRQRGNTEFPLRNKRGHVYITADECTVVDISNEDGNVDIRLKIGNPEFSRFVKNVLEGTVLKRFTQKDVTKSVLHGENSDLIDMRFEKHVYERRQNNPNGKDTCARTNRGAQISLTSDINPGDRVCPMFQVVYCINEAQQQGQRDDGKKGVTVTLVPVKIIKIEQDNNGAEDETVTLNKQEIDGEKPETSNESSQSATVEESVYEESEF